MCEREQPFWAALVTFSFSRVFRCNGRVHFWFLANNEIWDLSPGRPFLLVTMTMKFRCSLLLSQSCYSIMHIWNEGPSVFEASFVRFRLPSSFVVFLKLQRGRVCSWRGWPLADCKTGTLFVVLIRPQKCMHVAYYLACRRLSLLCLTSFLHAVQWSIQVDGRWLTLWPGRPG